MLRAVPRRQARRYRSLRKSVCIHHEYLPLPGDIRAGIAEGREEFCAALLRRDGSIEPLRLFVSGLTDDERQILLDGCLMNHYKFRAEREG